MTERRNSLFLDSCLADVPFPLTCHLDLPPRRWEKVRDEFTGLEPFLRRFWEIHPIAEGDSFFFHHGAEFLAWSRGLGATTTLSLPPSRLNEDRLKTAVKGGIHRLVVVGSGEADGPGADRLASSARSLGIPAVVVVRGEGSVSTPDPAPAGREPDWKSRFKRCLVREYRPENLFSFPSLRPEGGKRKDCRFPWDSVRIARDLAIKPCPASERTLGRMGETPFEDVWNGALYREFRSALLTESPPEECRTCRRRGWFRPFAPAGWVWAGVNDRFGVQLGTGWHEREEGRAYRWSRKEGVFLLRNPGGKKLRMVLHLPSRKLSQEGEVFIDGKRAGEFRLRRPGDRLLSFPLPEGAGEEVVVKIAARREIVPREALGNDDLRRIGVAWKGAFLEG